MQRHQQRAPLAFATRRPWAVVGVTTAITAVALVFAARVRIDTDLSSLLPKNAEVNRLIAEYGGPQADTPVLVVAVQGAGLFSPGVLGAFSGAIARISAIPGVVSVTSPFNLPGFSRSPSGAVEIGPLSPGGRAPADEAAARELRARLLATGYATNLVASKDGTLLAAFVATEPLADVASVVREAGAAMNAIRLPGVSTRLSGPVAFGDRTRFYITRDVVTLPVLAALVVLVFYWISFRAGRGIVLPMVVVVLGTLWTVGFMGLLGIPLTLVSIVAPPLVLIFGNEYSIYVMNEYYRLGGLGAPGGARDGRRRWVDAAVTGVTMPIVMAFLTTIVGFLTLCITDVRQTQEFAVTASFGSLACGALALVFLPALLALLPAPSENRPRRMLEGPISRLMAWTARLANRHPLPILGVIPVLAAALVVALGSLTFNTDSSNYFPRKDPVIRDMYAMTAKIGGFDRINVTWVAPGGEARWFLDPGVLQQVAAVEEAIRQDPDVCYSLSFPSFLEDASFQLDGTAAIPSSRGALLFFSRLVSATGGGAGGASASILGQMASPTFDRLTLSMRIYNSSTGWFMDEQRFRSFLARLEATVDARGVRSAEGGAAARPVIWGDILRNLYLADSLRRYLVISMLISYASIFLLAAPTFRSVLKGLYAVIPLACGLMLNFIAMAVFRIPLDMTTIMVANITIGVGIDGGIYLVIEYLRQLRASPGDFPGAIGRTLAAMGRAIIVSTISIVAGLAVFMSAAFRPVVYFGLLVICSLTFTAAATLVVLPAVLALDHRRRGRRAAG